ncbi:MAG: hypothetical protein QNK34_03955 [Woeseiaceae bacterium]|nr:hypothetical protein [Woeseiaceae bacterium]
MLSIANAQQDMREAYYGGATGAVTSATIWLIAALVTTFATPVAGILTLVFGGMLIFPASVLLSKVIGRSGKHSKDNPLAPLAIEGTIWMLLSIPLAVGCALYKVDWFFPAMLLVIAGRYLTFATLYGMRIYWVFGATLALSAVPMVILEAPTFTGAYVGALIEYVYGIAIFVLFKSNGTQ